MKRKPNGFFNELLITLIFADTASFLPPFITGLPYSFPVQKISDILCYGICIINLYPIQVDLFIVRPVQIELINDSIPVIFTDGSRLPGSRYLLKAVDKTFTISFIY